MQLVPYFIQCDTGFIVAFGTVPVATHLPPSTFHVSNDPDSPQSVGGGGGKDDNNDSRWGNIIDSLTNALVFLGCRRTWWHGVWISDEYLYPTFSFPGGQTNHDVTTQLTQTSLRLPTNTMRRALRSTSDSAICCFVSHFTGWVGCDKRQHLAKGCVIDACDESSVSAWGTLTSCNLSFWTGDCV